MEKKTIGKFISVLRRAGGMTQKELGDKLFVSDKTVSRWERDECTPELSLIPAIAELFGITTDELLRGERSADTGETTRYQKAKSDKQFQVMLHNRMTRFRNLSFISVGIAIAGIILAVVIDLSFFKGILAFGIGAIFILAGVICQLCFASSSILRRDEEDDSHGEEVRRANSRVAETTAAVLMVMIVLFAFILPMGLHGGAYYALEAGSLLLLGLAYAAAALILCYILYILWIRKLMYRKGMILNERADVRNLLKRTMALAAVIALVLTVCYIAVGLLGPEVYDRQVETFTDPEEFRTFMQACAVAAWQTEQVETGGGTGDKIIPGDGIVYIDYGNDGWIDEVVRAPEFELEEITDKDGNVLCQYPHYRDAVGSIEWKLDPQTNALEIFVHTRENMEHARAVYRNIHTVLELLLVLEILVCSAVYVVKLRKIRT